MKVLFTFYIPSGGIETLNRQRFKALKEEGIESHFLYLREGSGRQNIDHPNNFFTSNESKIKELVVREKYDLIVTSTNTSILPTVKTPQYKGSIVYEVQGIGGDIKRFLRAEKEKINTFCDAMLSPLTPNIKEAIITEFPNFPYYHFHNCFYTDDFKEIKTGGFNHSPIIGWVGRLEDNKNFECFLRIAHLLKKRLPTCKFWLFHDEQLATPVQKKKYHRLVKSLGLEKQIQVFSGIKHKEMPYYYSFIGQSNGVLCSTSKQEGFGYSVVEAMACGCPVVSTNSEGVEPLIQNYKTGIFFDHNDYIGGAKAIYYLTQNHVQRNKIKKEALEHIKTLTDPIAYARSFKEMMLELAKNKKKK